MYNSFLPFKRNSLKSRILNVVYILFLIALIIGILIFLDIQFNIHILCIFRSVTGFYCPGCGITRGLIALFKLEFYQAFRYNVLLIPSVPFILLCIIDKTVHYLRKKDYWFYNKIPNKIWVAMLVLLLVFGVLRNIPGLEFLAPTEI